MDLEHGSISTEHSETLLEGSGSSKNSETRKHSETHLGGSGSSKHSETHLDGSRSSKHSETHLDGSGSSEHLETHLEGSGSSKHSGHAEDVDGSVRSKHSESQAEVDETGSRDHSETLERVVDGIENSSLIEKHEDLIDESQRNKQEEVLLQVIDVGESVRHTESYLEVADVSGSFEQLDDQDEDRNNCLTIHTEDTTKEGILLTPIIKLESSWTSFSSTSSSAASIVLSHGDTNEETKPSTHITAVPEHDIDSQSMRGGDSFSSINSSKSVEHNDSPLGSTSTYQVSDITQESIDHGMPSPAVQVMERSGEYGGYDPFRIPSSVFASKSTTPMEWSAASNESLFSIHVGNTSFSRDHVFMYGGDMTKSGELMKSGELFLFNPPSPFPAFEIDRENTEVGNEYGAERVARKSRKNEAKVSNEDSGVGKGLLLSRSSSHSRPSDASEISARSFAFPIKKRRTWPLCYCSNCSWAFCYCTWPSCYCWNCSWAFCYSWNCSLKGICCHSLFILPGGMKSDSLNTDGKEQNTEALPDKDSSKSVASRCFPFLSRCSWPWNFSCRRFCCCF